MALTSTAVGMLLKNAYLCRPTQAPWPDRKRSTYRYMRLLKEEQQGLLTELTRVSYVSINGNIYRYLQQVTILVPAGHRVCADRGGDLGSGSIPHLQGEHVNPNCYTAEQPLRNRGTWQCGGDLGGGSVPHVQKLDH